MIACIIAMLGACMGSFICVAFSRFSPLHSPFIYLSTISLTSSSCPNCLNKLKVWQLVPLLSYLLLRQRCYACQAKIPAHYFLLELAMSVLFMVIYWHKGITAQSIVLMMLGCYFLLLALIDFKYYLLPDFFTQPLMWGGLLAAYLNISNILLTDAFIGILCGYLLLKVPASLFYLISNKHGLGGGDIKLLAAIGAWIPYHLLPLLVIMASILGIFYFLILNYLFYRQSLKVIPFGPFLLISAYCCCYFS